MLVLPMHAASASPKVTSRRKKEMGGKQVSHLLKWWIFSALSNNSYVPSGLCLSHISSGCPLLSYPPKVLIYLVCLCGLRIVCVNASIEWLEALKNPTQSPSFMPQ